MKIQRMTLTKSRRSPAEVYYSAYGRVVEEGVVWQTVGWGPTPNKARLNLLYNMNRRRFPVE